MYFNTNTHTVTFLYIKIHYIYTPTVYVYVHIYYPRNPIIKKDFYEKKKNRNTPKAFKPA